MCIFTGEEWWCLKVRVAHLETLCARLKGAFKADLSTNTTHLHDGVTLLLRPQVTQAHCLCHGFHKMVKFREHMGRSLGLEIC